MQVQADKGYSYDGRVTEIVGRISGHHQVFT